MAKKLDSQGKCVFCKTPTGLSLMTRHLQACANRAEKLWEEEASQKKIKFYGLKIWAANDPSYWFFLEVTEDACLEHLDTFLRQVWLECCGHLSSFTIQGTRYETQTGSIDGLWSVFRQTESKLMDVRFAEVLSKGLGFNYEYDFGSTTDLDIKVVWEREGRWKKTSLSVLARNEAPVFHCAQCQKEAASICTECGWGKEAFYCNECAVKHPCGDEMLLPIVNSPRMGVCGYTGADSKEECLSLEFSANFTSAEKVGRNEPCPCGSGKKFKKCCLV